MKKETWKLFGILLAVATVLLLLWDMTIALGYLVGGLLAAVLYFRNASYWGDILDMGTVSGSRYGFHFLINMAIMAAPMLFAALYPEILNIFAVAVGLMMIKITVTFEVLFMRKGGAHEDTV